MRNEFYRFAATAQRNRGCAFPADQSGRCPACLTVCSYFSFLSRQSATAADSSHRIPLGGRRRMKVLDDMAGRLVAPALSRRSVTKTEAKRRRKASNSAAAQSFFPSTLNPSSRRSERRRIPTGQGRNVTFLGPTLSRPFPEWPLSGSPLFVGRRVFFSGSVRCPAGIGRDPHPGCDQLLRFARARDRDSVRGGENEHAAADAGTTGAV